MKLSDIDRNPNASTLRQFGLLSLAVFGGLGAWKWYSNGPSALYQATIGVGAVLGLIGLAAPKLLRWVFVGAMFLVFPIGYVVSHTLLGIVYYGLFTPLALLFRLTGRDRLYLRKPARESYWIERQPAPEASAYFRQF